SLETAEISALFHDAGKINPNFQSKIMNGGSIGYSNHSYLSAYILWCYHCANPEYLVNQFRIESINEFLQLIVIIAKHHSNLPNFISANYKYFESRGNQKVIRLCKPNKYSSRGIYLSFLSKTKPEWIIKKRECAS
ncbi:MAG: CRISPR-associated endonuclease Cas3'', partial [Flavobacteriales bacterium]